MTSPSPAVGDLLRLGDDLVRLVEIGPGTSTVKTLGTGELHVVPTGEVAQQVAVDRIGDPALMGALSPSQRDRVTFLHRHIHEVLYGLPPDAPVGMIPDPRYAPTLPIGVRLRSKSLELKEQGVKGMARTALREKVRAYRAHGVAGLIDGRSNPAQVVSGRSDPRLVALFEDYVARQTMRSTEYKKVAITVVGEQARAEGIPLPSRATLYRLLATVDANRGTFGLASTRRTKANQPGWAFGSATAYTPGAIIEIDSTPLDVLVMYPDGIARRPDLTYGIDLATRSLVGALLAPKATKGVDAAMLLARILTPMSSRPECQDGSALALLPDDMFNDRDGLMTHVRNRPLITPQTVTVDRGKVYQSDVFMRACERLNISVTNAAPYSPTNKPHVERVFASTNSLFIQFLNGYTGHDVARRGRNVAAEAFWTLDQMQTLIDLWIAVEYQNRPHDGLRHPSISGVSLTPNEACDAFRGLAPTVPIALTRNDLIGLLNVDFRVINAYGINFNGLHYNSPELAPLRGQKSGLPGRGRKWEVRYDPHDCKTLYVRDTRPEGSWIEARWVGAGNMEGPLALDLLNAALAAAKTRTGKQARDLHPGAVVEEIVRIQSKPRGRTERAATRQAARTTLHIPPAPPPPAPAVEPAVETPVKRRPMRRADEEF